ncbi:glycoside hydrolase family 9 protein [Streptomyces melanogenes]|uniref:glycoside hydrolase family 9 protein n=1 Tax=Streptomyces melanogenes TaxID=67326 RepID=UPI0037A72052
MSTPQRRPRPAVARLARLRRRLTVLFAATTAACLVVLAVVAASIDAHSRTEGLDKEVGRRADGLARAVWMDEGALHLEPLAEDALAREPGALAVVSGRPGPDVRWSRPGPEALPASARLDGLWRRVLTEQETVYATEASRDGTTLRWAVSPVWDDDSIGAAVLVGADPGPGRRDHALLVRWLVLGCAALVLAAALIGHLLSGRSMRPALRALDQQEQFLAEAAHELRTPLATLRATLESGGGAESARMLPEADDALDVREGDPAYTIKHRPVFRANEPGAPISPNLAGRVAAAFALAAQADAKDNPERAEQWLEKAAAVYGQADTEHTGELVTAFPHGFYAEESWQDDMEFGAAELALAARKLDDSRAARWQREAGEWASKYIGSDARGTLGVADVSALAHADLLRLGPSGAAVADLRRQLADGERRAAKDPFRAGAVYTDFDAVPHTFGLVATARLYAKATGDRGYDAFAERQRGWALGANAWGTGFMVGAGESYPHCPEHQVANLTGTPLRGAVVNGPNAAAKLSELNSFDTMRPCAYGTDTWKRFDGHGARYLDHVGAWQTVEPADDFTSTALLAFALTAGGG